MLAELSTKEISETTNPGSFPEHEDVARRGGNIAKDARIKLEPETGRKLVSALNAKSIRSLEASKNNNQEGEE